MEITLTLTITTDAKLGLFDVEVLEGESGCTRRFTDIPCGDNRETFNRNIGNEIYSWVLMMLDEEKEDENND